MKIDPRNCTCLTLRAATRRLTQRYDQALAPTGLRIGQYSLLSFIDSFPGDPSITQLADFLDMDISTATRNLRPILNAGYVTMKVVPGDARRRELQLTNKGQKLLGRAYAAWFKVESAVRKEMGSGQHAELSSLLRKVA